MCDLIIYYLTKYVKGYIIRITKPLRRYIMKVDKNKCLGCGACASMCPVGAITMKGGKAEINKKKCIKCGTCKDICPVGAITDDK